MKAAFSITMSLVFILSSQGLWAQANQEAIQHDAERSGLRREGTFTSIYSFMEKTAFAFGPLVIGLLLASSGFSPESAGDPTPEAIRAILIASAIIPAAASASSANGK